MKFPVQLAETKSSVCTFNRATLDWTERFEADKYVARPESLYGLASEKNAREFLDVARSRLRHVDHALGHAVDLRCRGPTPLAALSIGMRKDRGGLPVAGRASFGIFSKEMSLQTEMAGSFNSRWLRAPATNLYRTYQRPAAFSAPAFCFWAQPKAERRHQITLQLDLDDAGQQRC